MSVNDAKPDMGAFSGIPDIGAWQFVIPDGLRVGTLRSRPAVVGDITCTATTATGTLRSRVVAESEFGAVQT